MSLKLARQSRLTTTFSDIALIKETKFALVEEAQAVKEGW